MAHPRDYTVNEAWIVFRLNDDPVRTGRDGDFDIVCLMDAASCYIFGNEFFAAGSAEVPEFIAKKLIKTGKAAAGGLPRKLLLSSTLSAEQFAQLGEHSGIEVERVADTDLTSFLSEARQSFRAHIAQRP